MGGGQVPPLIGVGGQVTASTGAPASGVAAGTDGPVWHTLNADRVLETEKVDEQSGLSSAEAAARAEQFGPNKFDAGKSEPRWRAFLRQYTDLMQIVLLAAGVVSLLLQEWETGIVLLVLTLFNRDQRRAPDSVLTGHVLRLQVRHRHRRVRADAPAHHRLRSAPGIPQYHQPRRPAVVGMPGRGAIHRRRLRDPHGRSAVHRTRPSANEVIRYAVRGEF
jgi:hypothetical protein